MTFSLKPRFNRCFREIRLAQKLVEHWGRGADTEQGVWPNLTYAWARALASRLYWARAGDGVCAVSQIPFLVDELWSSGTGHPNFSVREVGPDHLGSNSSLATAWPV